jgi:hypothetical protein
LTETKRAATGLEHLVAGLMAMEIVDGLETVQVDQ